jgi:hypothetical protein
VLVGFNRFVTDNIAFNCNVGYQYSQLAYNQQNNGSNSYTYTSIYKSNALYWSLGFSMFIPTKKNKV